MQDMTIVAILLVACTFALCTCQRDVLAKEAVSPDNRTLCVNQGVKVTVISQGTAGILTAQEIVQVIEGRIVEGFVNPRNTSFSCIDGRARRGVFGTPGGDAGEFLLALTIYDRYCSIIRSCKTNVNDLFVKYVVNALHNQSFYMHTSSEAVESLAAELGVEKSEIENPVSKTLQDRMLVKLIEPEYIGCGHIRLMVQYPEEYLIPTRLTEGLIKSFYKFLWNNQFSEKVFLKMDLEILNGYHEEKGVIQVTRDLIPSKTTFLDKPFEDTEKIRQKVEDEDEDEGEDTEAERCDLLYPLIRPTVVIPEEALAEHFYINHYSAVEVLRLKNAKFFVKQLSSFFPDLTILQFQKEIDMLADKQLYLTVGHLAPTLAIFNATVSQGQLDVLESDSVMHIIFLFLVMFIVIVIGLSVYFFYKRRRNHVEFE